MVIVHVSLDRGTKKALLVESFESLPVYYGIVSSRKDYFIRLQLLVVISKILWALELTGKLG